METFDRLLVNTSKNVGRTLQSSFRDAPAGIFLHVGKKICITLRQIDNKSFWRQHRPTGFSVAVRTHQLFDIGFRYLSHLSGFQAYGDNVMDAGESFNRFKIWKSGKPLDLHDGKWQQPKPADISKKPCWLNASASG